MPGYTLEPPRRGGSNEHPQSMLWSKNKKNRMYHFKHQFFHIKVGLKGVFIAQICLPDDSPVYNVKPDSLSYD